MKTERFEMRADRDFLKLVDDWRRAQPDIPPRAEAIRRIVIRALSSGDDPTLSALLKDWFSANHHRIGEFGMEAGVTPEKATTIILEDGARQSPVIGAKAIIDIFDAEPDSIAKQIVALLSRVAR